MTDNNTLNTSNNTEGISQAQQNWEELLITYRKEREELRFFIYPRDRAEETSPELDDAKLRLIQLEVMMKQHIDYGFKSPYLNDLAKKYNNDEYVPMNRNEKIHGLIYTNYGIPPFHDTGTREGYYNDGFLKTKTLLKTKWSAFMSRLEEFYDGNKGDIRKLCEMGGDYIASDAAGKALSGTWPRSPVPNKPHSWFVGQLGDQSTKPLKPGEIACNHLLGPKAKPFRLP